jgi:hypothetical protein
MEADLPAAWHGCLIEKEDETYPIRLASIEITYLYSNGSQLKWNHRSVLWCASAVLQERTVREKD